MKLGTVSKQPNERESYTIQYEDDLTEGDNLKSSVVSATGGITIDQTFIFDTRVRFFVSGGTTNQSYKVTVVTHTEDGRIMEDEVTIRVREL